MIINKTWSMPNSKTFKIPAIRALILKYAIHLTVGKPYQLMILDPFANEASIQEPLKETLEHSNRIENLRYVSNDIDP
jgi:hypothetical protein